VVYIESASENLCRYRVQNHNSSLFYITYLKHGKRRVVDASTADTHTHTHTHTHFCSLYYSKNIHTILVSSFWTCFQDKKIRFWWKNRKVLEAKHPLFIRSNAPRHSKRFV